MVFTVCLLGLTQYSAEFPEDNVSALETNEHITVEADSEVKTQ